MMRSRIAGAAIAASLVAGLAACSTTSKAPAGGAPTAPGASPSTTAAAGAATPTAPTAPVTASSSAAEATSASFATDKLETMRAKVAAVYGQGFTPGAHFEPPTVDQKELAADFDSKATMDAVWGTGAVGADRPMDCGMPKYNGIALGAVKSSGDAATIPVALYNAEKAGSAAAIVTVDPATGVIKGVTCGSAPTATDFPGIAPIGTYYGATASLDNAVLNDKSQPNFTPAFTAWQPADWDYNKYVCSQNVPDLWTVALTGTSSSASTWDYEPGRVSSIPNPNVPSAPAGFTASLAVDLGSAKISRVTCRAFPPVLDKANPAQYATSLMEYYRLAADQKSLGVDPAAAIKSSFVSDDAFTKAWNSTGAVPLLCSKTVPGSAEIANNSTGTTSGSQITFSMVTWKTWHPDNPGQELSKFTLAMDASTMKIASITCTK